MDKRRILIFENSDVLADILLEFLGGEEYETRRAKSSLEGLKLVFSFVPELIITNAEMPFFNGYLITRILKSRSAVRGIPVIIFSSL